MIRNSNGTVWSYNDGGRSDFFRARCVGDCATRALAIATDGNYKECYNIMWKFNHGTPRNGVSKKAIFEMMKSLGYRKINCENKNVRISDIAKKDGESYYVLIKDHALCIKNHVVEDTWNSCKEDSKVLAYYHIK